MGDRRATLPGIHTISVKVPVIALGDSEDHVIASNNFDSRMKVVACRVLPDALHAGADTNNMLIGLVNKGILGVGAVVVAPQKEYASGVDLVAFKPDDIPVSATAADVIIAEDEVLAFSKTEGGTGLASPELVVEVDVEFIGPTI